MRLSWSNCKSWAIFEPFLDDLQRNPTWAAFFFQRGLCWSVAEKLRLERKGCRFSACLPAGEKNFLRPIYAFVDQQNALHCSYRVFFSVERCVLQDLYLNIMFSAAKLRTSAETMRLRNKIRSSMSYFSQVLLISNWKSTVSASLDIKFHICIKTFLKWCHIGTLMR